jgi:predicted CopG family antitoxin
MSTKTIALESSVYERFARAKRGSESFTKTIQRLLDESLDGTCAAAVAETAAIWGESANTDREAELMERLLVEGRKGTDWEVERPR